MYVIPLAILAVVAIAFIGVLTLMSPNPPELSTVTVTTRHLESTWLQNLLDYEHFWLVVTVVVCSLLLLWVIRQGWLPTLRTQERNSLVGLLGIGVLLALLHTLFPWMTAALVGAIGWPLLVVTAIALVFGLFFLTDMLRNVVVGGIVAVLAIILLPVIWNAIPSPPSAPITTAMPTAPVVTARPAPVQTVTPTRESCDNTYRDYRLTQQPKPIPCQGYETGMNIQEGGLYLIDRNGKKHGPFYKDQTVGSTPPVIAWAAEGSNTVVKARFFK
jgi:hypothetical protein